MNASGILYEILATSATVTGIVGTDTGGGWKIYPLTIPQKAALPAVRISEIAVEPFDTKSGASTLDAIRVQIDCYAASMLTVQQLTRAARLALDRYRGDAWDGETVWFVDGVRFENRAWYMEEEKDVFRGSFDIQLRVHRPGYQNYLVEDDGVTPITTEQGQFIIP